MTGFSVTPLGTVSPYPKGTCNCPGFLVQSGDKKVLLDCGSGISRLLHFPEDLNNLIIIISHLHLDHYSDLGSIGYASYVYRKLGILDKKIKVFHPPYGNCLTNDIIDFSYLETRKYSWYGYENYDSESELSVNNRGWSYDEKMPYGDMILTFFDNKHCENSYSIKITSGDKTIVYTADTGYSDSLVAFCKDADLLISEATFLEGQKCTKGHMYASEAGLLAQKAHVKKLMLTHFFPEIDKKLYLEEAKQNFENVTLAKEGKKLILRR